MQRWFVGLPVRLASVRWQAECYALEGAAAAAVERVLRHELDRKLAARTRPGSHLSGRGDEAAVPGWRRLLAGHLHVVEANGSRRDALRLRVACLEFQAQRGDRELARNGALHGP